MTSTADGMPPSAQQEEFAMFKFIGAAVVYGFALFGLATYLNRNEEHEAGGV